MRIISVLKRLLMVWGLICLLGGIGLAGLILYRVGPGNKASDDRASKRDVRFVLNWCKLGDQRIQEVVHSHISPRSFTGDHLDAFAIRISSVEISELEKSSDDHGRWYRGDQLPAVISDAVEFAAGWQREVPWFPDASELKSSKVYLYPWSTYLHGVRPTSAQLIFVRPADKMVFFIDAKM